MSGLLRPGQCRPMRNDACRLPASGTRNTAVDGLVAVFAATGVTGRALPTSGDRLNTAATAGSSPATSPLKNNSAPLTR